MRRRRRRVFRDEVLAPWLTVGVILGCWWLGASLIGSDVVAPFATRSAVAEPARSTKSSRGRSTDVSDAIIRADDRDREAIPVPADRAEPPPDELAAPAPAAASGDIVALRDRRLLVPVAGIEARSLRSTFEDPRGGGRRHEAMDILAPRGTAVLAAVDGRVVKLFTSAAGGLTIYQYDPEEEFCYYYAHLDGYVSDLAEGQTVKRGQTIGYVGTTGNAPPGTPHLHFAIFKLDANKRWWEGDPLDPYLALR